MKRKPRRPAGLVSFFLGSQGLKIVVLTRDPSTSYKSIARLEERLAEVEGLLGNRTLSKQNEAENGPSEAHMAFATSLDASLLTSQGGSYPEVLTTEAQGPPSGQMMSPDFEVLAASSRQDSHLQTELSMLAGYVVDPLSGSGMWLESSKNLRRLTGSPHQPLPTRAVALQLVHETMRDYNRFIPIFDEKSFLREFQLKYAISDPEDAGWWACLNVVLSIAHRLRALRSLDPTHENSLAYGYTQNALSVISQLNVINRSLSVVQALVGMACILQGTSDPEPASMLVGAALRLAQAMNLHRESSSPGLTGPEIEQRRRVFWKVYILDKDISLRTGRPFSQDDDDMDVRLPSNTGLEPCNVDHFNHRIGLAVIQGQVYKQLYSIQAGRQPESRRAAAAQELKSLISYWKSSALLDSQQNSTMSSGVHISGTMVHDVVLQLTYTHCLTMIDRHLPPTTQFPYQQELRQSERLVTPDDMCVFESRKAILVFHTIPQGDRSCVW